MFGVFIWNQAKSLANIKKHGVSFEEAESVFIDESGYLMSDPDHSLNEDRYILLGMSAKLKILVVVHVYKDNDEIIRIISARKATKTERKMYKRS